MIKTIRTLPFSYQLFRSSKLYAMLEIVGYISFSKQLYVQHSQHVFGGVYEKIDKF